MYRIHTLNLCLFVLLSFRGFGEMVLTDKETDAVQALFWLQCIPSLHSSPDHQKLQPQIATKVESEENVTSTHNEEAQDFSGSASDWQPTDDNSSTDDEEEVQQKKAKMDRISMLNTNKRRVIKPSHRPKAINVYPGKCRKRKTDVFKTRNSKHAADKRLPSTGINNITQGSIILQTQKSDVISVNMNDLIEMNQCFQELFRIVEEFPSSTTGKPQNNQIVNTPQPIVKPEANNTLQQDDDVEDEHDMSGGSEDLNRSDDNVLITNKYEKANKKILTEKDTNENEKSPEWKPIGSGKTLIHKNRFKKINWRSYSIATRTLLLACFPRRVLATHSLTGRKSPAFKNKPAKMLLDPKIVTDIIIEVTRRFKVKESLVRIIITTKCADECKMLRMRQEQKANKKRKTMPAQQKQDNIKLEHDKANRTR